MNMIAKKLKELRGKKPTQKEFAEIIGISETGYASWEQGLAEPNIEHISKIAKYYEISADELLGIEESQEYKEPQKKPLEFLSKDEQFIIKSFRKFGQSRKKTILDLIHMSIDSEENSKID